MANVYWSCCWLAAFTYLTQWLSCDLHPTPAFFSVQISQNLMSPSCVTYVNVVTTGYWGQSTINSMISVINSLPLFWHFYSNGSHATSCVCTVPASFKNAWNVLKCDVTVHRGFRESLKLCLPLRNTRTGTSWTWKSGLFRELGSLCICQLLLCSSSSAPLVRQCYHGGLSCFQQTKVGACWYWWLISRRPSALLEINELPVTC